MTYFDRDLAKKIQADAVVALEKVAKKYGVNISYNGGTLGTNDFILKLKVEVANAVKTYDPWVYKAFNLPEDIIGKTFVNRGTKYTITELNTKAPKFPVNVVDENGKGFKFPVDAVRTLLKLK
jgi:hypothetical protein